MKTANACALFAALVIIAATPVVSHALMPVTEDLLVNLNLTLDKSVLPDTDVVVRIHATDRLNDQYFSSQPDPDQGTQVEWNREVQLLVDNDLPLRLIFTINALDGAPLPAGISVEWTYTMDNGGRQPMAGNAITIPAGTSGDTDLTVRGAIVSQ